MLAVLPVNAPDLFSTGIIRERCANITRAVEAGDSTHFRIDRRRLAPAARIVAEVTRRRFGDRPIPYHSRWRHFNAGGIDRTAELARQLGDATVAERLRAQIDLTVVSVLLDAGAGGDWRYREPGTIDDYARSEGLGVAAFRAFIGGAWSASPGEPLRVDGTALAGIDAATLGAWFQTTPRNPLPALDARARLLRRLGDVLETRPDRFGLTARPSGLFERMLTAKTVSAPALLRAVLEGFSGIWPDDRRDVAGDVWRHRNAGGAGATAGCAPFHKLSQWLVYSLFEPFEWAGIGVTDRDALTGLAEYRNGGLLVDAGVLRLVDEGERTRQWDVGDEIVVEWRALTVTLLDDLAECVRAELDQPQLPLSCVLEGGTWAAGREFATRLRHGAPPLDVRTGGTVF